MLDANVLIAGTINDDLRSATTLIMALGANRIFAPVVSEYIVEEARRNLYIKTPALITQFQDYVSSYLVIVKQQVAASDLKEFDRLADKKDAPILAAAVLNKCPILVTNNWKDFQPGHPAVQVMTPGDFLDWVRHRLAEG